MAAELDPLLKLIGQVGIFVAAAGVLWYTVFVPRKNKDNDPKSALLVPGWIVDDLKREADRRVLFYEKALADEQERANVRISEWRGFRDEAVAKAVDAQEDRKQLLEAVQSLSRDVQVLLQIHTATSGSPDQAESGKARG
jgi:hypothetical protein